MRRGFTLLETMFALAILGLLLTAVTEVNTTAMIYGGRVYNMTTASELISAAVLDIEEEYREDGFPENTVENEDCPDFPGGFDRFKCTYDLLGLDVADGMAQDLGGDAEQSVTNSPLMNALCTGGPSGAGPVADPTNALANLGLGAASVGALMSLLDPNFMALCGVNLARMCMNIKMISSFIPTIIEQAAKSTRKLQVRLTWSEAGHADTTLEVQTFLTSSARGEQEREKLTQ